MIKFRLAPLEVKAFFIFSTLAFLSQFYFFIFRNDLAPLFHQSTGISPSYFIFFTIFCWTNIYKTKDFPYTRLVITIKGIFGFQILAGAFLIYQQYKQSLLFTKFSPNTFGYFWLFGIPIFWIILFTIMSKLRESHSTTNN